MKHKHKFKNFDSHDNVKCPVCSSEFVEDLSRDCNHICPSCELILLQCPVCLEILKMEHERSEGITETGGTSNLPTQRIDQVVGEILANQKKSSVEAGALLTTTKLDPVAIHSQILKHCFIGVWDGAINCVAAAFGLKSPKSIIARNINSVILRIGRQTGRSVQPTLCSKLSKSAAVKTTGGLVAVLLCLHIMLRRYGSK